MDHAEEQISELEALESIYCGEFEVISSEPSHVFTISIKSDDFDEDEEKGIFCRVKFEYTPKYPDEIPIILVEDVVNLDLSDEEELTEYLQKQAEENLGMVMIFTLVSAAQEWINTKSDDNRREHEEREERKKREEEEAELKRFEGTRVTVETFLNWKQNFDLEMGQFSKKEKEDKVKKLTGKELFMEDKSLNESDLKFLEEGGEFVKVDESLFQDLDDLDLENELSDEDA